MNSRLPFLGLALLLAAAISNGADGQFQLGEVLVE